MRSSSLKMVMQHGIKSPQKYRDALIHEWYVPEEYKQHLQQHFLVREAGGVLSNRIKEGTITVGSYIYEVVWIHKPQTVYKERYALLSFRYCKYLNCGYALIKKYEQETGMPDVIPMIDYTRK